MPEQVVDSEKCEACSSVLSSLNNAGVDQRLNPQNANLSVKGRQILAHKGKEVAYAYGGGFGAKALSLGFAYADTKMGKANAPPEQQIFTWGNLAVGLGLGLLAATKGGKMREPEFDAVLAAGVVAATELVDPLERIAFGQRYTRQNYAVHPVAVPPVSNRYNLSGVDTIVPPPKASRPFS